MSARRIPGSDRALRGSGLTSPDPRHRRLHAMVVAAGAEQDGAIPGSSTPLRRALLPWISCARMPVRYRTFSSFHTKSASSPDSASASRAVPAPRPQASRIEAPLVVDPEWPGRVGGEPSGQADSTITVPAPARSGSSAQGPRATVSTVRPTVSPASRASSASLARTGADPVDNHLDSTIGDERDRSDRAHRDSRTVSRPTRSPRARGARWAAKELRPSGRIPTTTTRPPARVRWRIAGGSALVTDGVDNDIDTDVGRLTEAAWPRCPDRAHRERLAQVPERRDRAR